MIFDVYIFFDAEWIRFILGFIIGACLGSFAGVLAYRVPHRLSVIYPRSHCLSCKKILSVRDLVPIISWIAFRGRCRFCHAKIGAQFLFIEIIAGFACAIATLYMGFTFWLLAVYAIIVAIIVALFIKKKS